MGRSAGRPGVIWEGSFLTMHSYSHFNRELVSELKDIGLDIGLLSRGDEGRLGLDLGYHRFSTIKDLLGRHPSRADVHIRHIWPPDFARPHAERFILIQPWEYGWLPSAWVDQLRRNVDEVWAYSNFVRETYVRSGFPETKVFIVPCGVNPGVFNPNPVGGPLPLGTNKSFKFLFVGGAATARKGFDILLRAYVNEFSSKEDVCLVVKDYFYGNVEWQINEMRNRPGCPEILYLYSEVPYSIMPGIYRTCDCYVHPYRAEGFGLPILEAMASGLPAIVTGYGPSLDYCNHTNSYLVPAQVVTFPERSVGGFPTVDAPFWAEPDGAELARLMRHVFEHREEAREKGRMASSHVLSRYTWENSARVAAVRVRGGHHGAF